MKKLLGLIVVLVVALRPGPGPGRSARSSWPPPARPRSIPARRTWSSSTAPRCAWRSRGSAMSTRKCCTRCWTAPAPRTLQSLTFGYDPLSAWVEVKEMKVLRADGGVETVPLTAVRDYPAPARAIYWGAREIIVPAGRLEPGDGVFVKTYQKGFTYALLGADAPAAAQAGRPLHPAHEGPFLRHRPVLFQRPRQGEELPPEPAGDEKTAVRDVQRPGAALRPPAGRPDGVFLGGEGHRPLPERGRHGRPLRRRPQAAASPPPPTGRPSRCGSSR